MSRQIFLLVLLLVQVNLSSTFAQTPPAAQRKWTDASGQFSVDAEFVKLTAGKVELKKADGKLIAIPLEKLAAADQEVAKALAANNPATAVLPAGDGSRVEYVTYRGITQLAKLPDNVPWRGEPDPRPNALPAVATKPVFVPLAEGEASINAAYLDDINQQAWIMVTMPSPNSNDPRQRLERVDLRTGERLAPILAAHYDEEPVTVSPSGRFAAVFVKNYDGVLKIFDLSANPPRKVRTICPFHEQALMGMTQNLDETRKGEKIANAIFVDDSLLLVQSGPRNLALIDLKTLNAKYFIECIGEACPSPGRKQVAVRSGNHYHMVDVLTGKSLGVLNSTRNESFYDLAYHPDGNWLAGADRKKGTVWNVATGQVEYSQQAALADDAYRRIGFGKNAEHLVIEGKTVFNVKTGAIVSQVPVSAQNNPSFTHAGREWYLVFRDKEVGVSSLELPAE